VASSGREGVAVFERRPIELVITDLDMPDRDGIEVVLEVKPSSRPVPIIVMSAGGSDARSDELAAAQLLDATIVLRKPLGLTRLRAAIAGVQQAVLECPARNA